MDPKLIVQVLRVRESGTVIPRHNLAFAKPFEGVFTLHEERVPDLNRHSRVARLLNPQEGTPVLPELYDAALLRATADEWVVTGFERVEDRLRLVDCAQTWVITPARLNIDV